MPDCAMSDVPRLSSCHSRRAVVVFECQAKGGDPLSPSRRGGRARVDSATPTAVLFTPIAISGVELRNRLVFQPHYTALGTFDGMPTERHAAYYEERARGG